MQALCGAESERIVVEERATRLQADRDAVAAELERLRRDMTSQHEVDRDVIGELQNELALAGSSLQSEM